MFEEEHHYPQQHTDGGSAGHEMMLGDSPASATFMTYSHGSSHHAGFDSLLPGVMHSTAVSPAEITSLSAITNSTRSTIDFAGRRLFPSLLDEQNQSLCLTLMVQNDGYLQQLREEYTNVELTYTMLQEIANSQQIPPPSDSVSLVDLQMHDETDINNMVMSMDSHNHMITSSSVAASGDMSSPQHVLDMQQQEALMNRLVDQAHARIAQLRVLSEMVSQPLDTFEQHVRPLADQLWSVLSNFVEGLMLSVQPIPNEVYQHDVTALLLHSIMGSSFVGTSMNGDPSSTTPAGTITTICSSDDVRGTAMSVHSNAVHGPSLSVPKRKGRPPGSTSSAAKKDKTKPVKLTKSGVPRKPRQTKQQKQQQQQMAATAAHEQSQHQQYQDQYHQSLDTIQTMLSEQQPALTVPILPDVVVPSNMPDTDPLHDMMASLAHELSSSHQSSAMSYSAEVGPHTRASVLPPSNEHVVSSTALAPGNGTAMEGVISLLLDASHMISSAPNAPSCSAVNCTTEFHSLQHENEVHAPVNGGTIGGPSLTSTMMPVNTAPLAHTSAQSTEYRGVHINNSDMMVVEESSPPRPAEVSAQQHQQLDSTISSSVATSSPVVTNAVVTNLPPVKSFAVEPVVVPHTALPIQQPAVLELSGQRMPRRKAPGEQRRPMQQYNKVPHLAFGAAYNYVQFRAPVDPRQARVSVGGCISSGVKLHGNVVKEEKDYYLIRLPPLPGANPEHSSTVVFPGMQDIFRFPRDRISIIQWALPLDPATGKHVVSPTPTDTYRLIFPDDVPEGDVLHVALIEREFLVPVIENLQNDQIVKVVVKGFPSVSAYNEFIQNKDCVPSDLMEACLPSINTNTCVGAFDVNLMRAVEAHVASNAAMTNNNNNNTSTGVLFETSPTLSNCTDPRTMTMLVDSIGTVEQQFSTVSKQSHLDHDRTNHHNNTNDQLGGARKRRRYTKKKNQQQESFDSSDTLLDIIQRVINDYEQPTVQPEQSTMIVSTATATAAVGVSDDAWMMSVLNQDGNETGDPLAHATLSISDQNNEIALRAASNTIPATTQSDVPSIGTQHQCNPTEMAYQQSSLDIARPNGPMRADEKSSIGHHGAVASDLSRADVPLTRSTIASSSSSSTSSRMKRVCSKFHPDHQKVSLFIPARYLIPIWHLFESHGYIVRQKAIARRKLSVKFLSVDELQKQAEEYVDKQLVILSSSSTSVQQHAVSSCVGGMVSTPTNTTTVTATTASLHEKMVQPLCQPLRSFVIQELCKRGSPMYTEEWIQAHKAHMRTRGPSLTPEQHIQALNAYYWARMATPHLPEYDAYEQVIDFYKSAGLDVYLKKPYQRTGENRGRSSASGLLRTMRGIRARLYSAASPHVIEKEDGVQVAKAPHPRQSKSKYNPGILQPAIPLMDTTSAGNKPINLLYNFTFNEDEPVFDPAHLMTLLLEVQKKQNEDQPQQRLINPTSSQPDTPTDNGWFGNAKRGGSQQSISFSSPLLQATTVSGKRRGPASMSSSSVFTSPSTSRPQAATSGKTPSPLSAMALFLQDTGDDTSSSIPHELNDMMSLVESSQSNTRRASSSSVRSVSSSIVMATPVSSSNTSQTALSRLKSANPPSSVNSDKNADPQTIVSRENGNLDSSQTTLSSASHHPPVGVSQPSTSPGSSRSANTNNSLTPSLSLRSPAMWLLHRPQASVKPPSFFNSSNQAAMGSPPPRKKVRLDDTSTGNDSDSGTRDK